MTIFITQVYITDTKREAKQIHLLIYSDSVIKAFLLLFLRKSRRAQTKSSFENWVKFHSHHKKVTVKSLSA